jgi:hypothetical protein
MVLMDEHASPNRGAYHVRQELLAMTPGTDQFADRLRAILVELDADQARLDRAIEDTDTRFGLSASGGRTRGSNDA